VKNLFIAGLLLSYISLIPVIHAALGEGLILTEAQWRLDALLGVLGVAIQFIAVVIAIWRRR